MMRQAALLAACICGLNYDDGAVETGKAPTAPRGHLVVVGGGPPIEDIYKRTLALAGGDQARILIVPFASPDPRAGEKSAAAWNAIGAANVSVLDLSDRDRALASIRDADLIWFRGGEQVRLMDHLAQIEGLTDAIRQRYENGGTIGGTSAGAAIMSRRMIAGPAGRRGTPEARLARLGDGLGLWPEVIVDQHFARRNRHLRLETAVQQYPDLLGIGIDEATAVIVADREFEVIGQGPVFVYDARKKPGGGPAAEAPAVGTPASGGSIAPVTLTAGMRYHLDRGLLADAQPAK